MHVYIVQYYTSLICARDKAGINVLNQRIELLERALQRQDEKVSPEGSGSYDTAPSTASSGRDYASSSRHETVDVESVRNGEGMGHDIPQFAAVGD